MTLDDVLRSLFGDDHDVRIDERKLVAGSGRCRGRAIAVVGIAGGTPLGIGDAAALAGRVIEVIERGEREPILVPVDTASQLMRRRDELLGLNEYLAHLAKSLLWAAEEGHPTVGLLYGRAAAGAFIATALATRRLVALPGAEPTVMDLPSIARVTKLPLDRLEAMADDTPVFAPGLDHLTRTGAIHEVWDPKRPLDEQLARTLEEPFDAPDRRDDLGAERGGRNEAATIARRVVEEATRG